MELSIPLITTAVSTVLFVVAAFATFRSIGKEQPITMMSPIFSILVQTIFLSFYTFVTGANFSPLLAPSLLIGLVVGLIVGGTTELYEKDDKTMSKRRKGFLVFWIASIILNQALITLGFGEGLALTVFSTGTLIGSEGKILHKISKAKPKPMSLETKVATPLSPTPTETKPGEALCPRCSNPIMLEKKFCTRCGQKIEQVQAANVCANCGARIKEGTKFCMKCGSSVD